MRPVRPKIIDRRQVPPNSVSILKAPTWAGKPLAIARQGKDVYRSASYYVRLRSYAVRQSDKGVEVRRLLDPSSEFLQSVMSSWVDTQPPFFSAWLKTAIVRSLESRCCVE